MKWVLRIIFYGGLVFLLVMIFNPPRVGCGTGPKGQTHAQFRGYTTALTYYHSEYGKYPPMFEDRESVNLANGLNSEKFQISLSGRMPDGQRPNDATRKRYNRRLIPYYIFSEQEIATPDGWSRPTLVDAYGNPNIVVHVDHDGDGFVTVPVDGQLKRVEHPICIYTIAENPDEMVMQPHVK